MDGEESTVVEQESTLPDGQTSGNLVVDDVDADFDSGFGGAPTETPVAKPEATEQASAEASEAAAIEQPPEFVQLTKADFDKLMSRAEEVDSLKTQFPQQVDKAFGKIGNIERILNDLKAQPNGQPLLLNEEDFAELKGEYPELAALQMKGMERILGKIRAPQVDTQAIQRMVGESTSGARSELIDTTLDTVIDGDWRAEVNTPAYKDWFAAQPDAVKSLQDSSSLRDAARLMRLYKVHRDAPPAKPEPQATKTPNARQRVIAAAVQPKGSVATVAANADDDFDSGFKSG